MAKSSLKSFGVSLRDLQGELVSNGDGDGMESKNDTFAEVGDSILLEGVRVNDSVGIAEVDLRWLQICLWVW